MVVRFDDRPIYHPGAIRLSWNSIRLIGNNNNHVYDSLHLGTKIASGEDDWPPIPYGTERVIVDNLDNNYKFTGHERDSESGLDHTLHRRNDRPELGG